MARNKRPIIVKQGLAGWVMTYGDMMTLLLTFFVLIVSFSSMQDAKFREAALSLRKAFGVLVQPQSVLQVSDPLIPRWEIEQNRDFILEIEAVQGALDAQGVTEAVELEFTPEGIVFRLDAPVFFAPASADLLPASHAPLTTIATFLQRFPGEVRVGGHSDSLPIQTARFPSNWELSASRSASVARYFQGQGLKPERMEATGYGEFRPLADNATAEGRARNRRVEVFLKVDRIQPDGGGKPLSRVLDTAETEIPRPTPVTDRLRSLH
jgi:chemotaxis protein MotB